MGKTRAILKRRKAVRNIRKITRTMELIATARFRKAMDRATAADAYTQKLSEIAGDLARAGASDVSSHPLLEARPEPKRGLLLVLTANRGLCGGYNANLTRLMYRTLRDNPENLEDIDLEVSGKRGIGFCRYQNIPTTQTYPNFEDKPQFDEVEPLADRYIEEFTLGNIDRLEVIYTRFHSMGRQSAEKVTLLPLGDVGNGNGSEAESGAEAAAASDAPQADYEFYPSAQEILNTLLPVSFKARLFKCFLDAAVSEQIARMVAMKGATENAGNLIKQISRLYNRARQSQITSELSEIIGTVEALK